MADYQGFAGNVLRSLQPRDDEYRQNALLAYKLKSDQEDRALRREDNALTRSFQERRMAFDEKREARAAKTEERQATAADIELGMKVNTIALQRAMAAQDEPSWRATVMQTAQEFEGMKPGLGATILPYADRFADRDKLIESMVDVDTRFKAMMERMPLTPEQEAQKVRIAAAGRAQTTLNVGDGMKFGQIPAGHVLRQLPDGGYAMEPVPGSPAAREVEAAKQKAGAAQEQGALKGSIVLTDIRRARERIESAPWYSPATGGLGNLLKEVGGTTAADVSALTDTVRANIGFDRLQAMREASPTGGALGQVTERELAQLQAVMGSLAQTQSEAQLLENIDRLDKIYSAIMRKAAAYPNAAQFGFNVAPEEGERAPAADTPAPPPGFVVVP